MRTFEKGISIFFLILGMSIFAVWIIILINGEVPGLTEEWFSFIMHWISEIILALSATFVSLAILKNKLWGKKSTYVLTGMAIASTFNATIFYLIDEQNLYLTGLLAIFFIGSIVVLAVIIANYDFDVEKSDRLELGMIGLGFGFYFLLNLIGKVGQSQEWGNLISAVFLLILTVIFSLKLIRNNNLVEPNEM